jgi:hypothetical protein
VYPSLELVVHDKQQFIQVQRCHVVRTCLCSQVECIG